MHRALSRAVSAFGGRHLSTFAPEIVSWMRPFSPGLLTKAEMEQFYNDGCVTNGLAHEVLVLAFDAEHICTASRSYVLKRDVFKPPELQPTIASVEGLVDTLAKKLQAGGKIKDTAASASFEKRLTLLEEQFPGASVLLHKNGVLPAAIAALWSDPRLLSVRAR